MSNLELWRAAYWTRVPPAFSIDGSVHMTTPPASDDSEDQDPDETNGHAPVEAGENAPANEDGTGAGTEGALPGPSEGNVSAVQGGSAQTVAADVSAPEEVEPSKALDASPATLDVSSSDDFDHCNATSDVEHLRHYSNAVVDGAMTSSLNELDLGRDADMHPPELPRAKSYEASLPFASGDAGKGDGSELQAMSVELHAASDACESPARVESPEVADDARTLCGSMSDSATRDGGESSAHAPPSGESAATGSKKQYCDASPDQGSTSEAPSAEDVDDQLSASPAVSAAASETFNRSKPIEIRRPHSVATQHAAVYEKDQHPGSFDEGLQGPSSSDAIEKYHKRTLSTISTSTTEISDQRAKMDASANQAETQNGHEGEKLTLQCGAESNGHQNGATASNGTSAQSTPSPTSERVRSSHNFSA